MKKRLCRATFRDERGVAMVTAMFASMVVLSLSFVGVGLSLHNSASSANERSRVQGIQAAEAGIDQVIAYFKTSAIQQICAPPEAVTDGAMSGDGAQIAQFHVTVQCDDANNPHQVLIRSVAYSPSQASPHHVTRKMESLVNVHPKGGQSSVFAHAMFHASSTVPLTVRNNLGGSNFNGADIYSNADVTVSNMVTVSGNVIGQKSVSMGNNAAVQGSVWTAGNVSMTQGAFVGGNVTSTAGGITLQNSARIAGNARAATTIVPTASVSGTSTQSSPSLPSTYESLPTFNWNATDPWPQPVSTYTSPTACSDFDSWVNANKTALVGTARIAGTGAGANCPWSLKNYTTMALAGDVAIISDGDISFANNSNVASADGEVHTLYLISLNGNLTFSNSTWFDPKLKIFAFTRNTLSLNNQNGWNGIAYANVLAINNQFTLQFAPSLVVPGFTSNNPGYDVDTVYVREVPSR